jgi:hypothetical protein
MEEKIKNEIAKVISGVIIKRFGTELGLDCREIIDSVLTEIREQVKAVKDDLTKECSLRLKRRFQSEVEPIINHLDSHIEQLITADKFSKVPTAVGKFDEKLSTILSRMAQAELESALRERAREWANKVAHAEVHFSFDNVFSD